LNKYSLFFQNNKKQHNIIENFNNNDLFHNNILINEIPQFSLNINKIFNKKFENKNSNLNSTTVQPKFNA
jgi:hypothetical protein